MKQNDRLDIVRHSSRQPSAFVFFLLCLTADLDMHTYTFVHNILVDVRNNG